MINNQQNNQSKNVTLPLLTDRRSNILSNNINNNSNNNNIINENLNNNKIEDETKNYIDDLKKGSYNILVVVRCRPLSILESQISSYETIRIMDNKMVVLMDPIEYNGPNSVFKNRSREITYAFDFAFDKYSTQKEIYDHSTKFLLDGVVNGYNATVFAYGATGAGKTYTMLGTELNPGIMVLTLEELFDKVKGVKLAMICSAVIFVAAVIAALYLRRPAGGTLVEIVQNGKHIATVDLSPRPACNQYSWLRVIRHFEPEMPCIISEPHLILSEIMKYLLKRYMIHITEDKKLLSALSE